MRVLVMALAASLTAAPLGAAASPAAAPPTGPHVMAVLRPCASAQLHAEVLADATAAGRRELRIGLTNSSPRPCAVDGYPALRLLDDQGNVQIAAEAFAAPAPRLFILAPSQQAVFRLRVAAGDGVTSYRRAARLAIVPPGDVAPLTLELALPGAPALETSALVPPAELP